MKTEGATSGNGGMSRAAKKRAKKKQKKTQQQQQPSEEIGSNKPKGESETKKRILKEDTVDGNANGEKLGGILKKSKYDKTATKSEPEPHDVQMDEDGGDEEVPTTGEELDGVVLPEEIRELLKSDDVNLKDILLLQDDKKKHKKKKANDDNNKDDVESDQENENPFHELTSKERARCAMNFLLAPSDLSAEEFYEEYWEKKALCVQSNHNSDHHRHRLDGFLSLKSIKKMTDKHILHYGKDLNVTRYYTVQPGKSKRRANIDPPPFEDAKTGETKYVEADSSFVWEQFEEHQATIRLLCPHKQNDTVHALLSLFELEWGCMVGANAYLTPPGSSQGFAPHFDDIEAFCLQLEGRKRWKVYAPPKEARLPRVSSEDFTDEDIRDMEPVIDVVLEPGDLLYMPRGWIHHGITLPGNEHSLHLTMSAMQQWAWVDYLELLMPEALQAAAMSETSISLRKGMPRNFLEYMGAMHDQRDDDLPERLRAGSNNDKQGEDDEDAKHVDEEALERERIRKLQDNFRDEAKRRIMRVAKEAMDMVDAACDQMGKRFLSDRLPPGFTPEELALTCDGQKDAKIWPSTLCRLARPGIARLVLEEGKAVVYHCADNSRVYHEVPLSPLEFEVDDAPALEQLVTTVEPNWVPVLDLIHETAEDKIAIAQSLYDEGILAIFNPEGDPK